MIDTITVNDVIYDIERDSLPCGEKLTLTLDGEPVFDGLEGFLGYEEYVEDSPRDWVNVGTMAISYRGYDLGDEDIEKIDFEIECPHCEGSGEDPNGNWVVGIHDTAERLVVGSQEECQTYIDNLPDVASSRYYIEPFGCNKCDGTGEITLNPIDYFKQARGARVVLGLTVYEHSGITMRAGNVTLPWDSDRWDTSFVGYIFDTPEGVKQCLGDNATDEQIEKALRSEVEVYASYLEGDVTFYRVDDDETNFYESCGSYIGDDEQCESECFETLKRAVELRLNEIKERADWAARDVVTI